MRIRAAGVVDANDITELVNSAYSGPDAELGWTPETHLHAGPRTTLSQVEDIFALDSKLILIAEIEEKILGCALLEHEAPICKLGMFAVHPRSQASGIGKRIIAAAENQAFVNWRCDRICMTAINMQYDLIAYYERRGFQKTGETMPFPHDDEPGALRFDYHLVVLEKGSPAKVD